MGVVHPGNITQEMDRQRRMQREAATGSPMASSSVTRGRVRIESEDGLVANQVPGGAAAIQVNGRQSVSGRLDGDGNLDWTGPTNLAGSTTIAGATSITGNVTTTGSFTNSGTFTNNGATKLNGATEVKGDLTVVSPGKVKVGTKMTLEPSDNGGSIQFPTGKLMDDGARTVMVSGNHFVSVSGSAAALSATSKQITVTNSYVQISGLPTANASAYPGGFLNAVVADSSGMLYRLV